MAQVYLHHVIECAPRTWQLVADKIQSLKTFEDNDAPPDLYGIWRSQIGLPRDTITVILSWASETTASKIAPLLFNEVSLVRNIETNFMISTLRPITAHPPRKQGNYAFRWFETPEENFEEFLNLCKEAWPTFESKYDSQIIGLWWIKSDPQHKIKTLLITRRPNLAMWERSKRPKGAIENGVREKLNRRYDLCDWTTVYTTTLLTANDGNDTTRWS